MLTDIWPCLGPKIFMAPLSLVYWFRISLQSQHARGGTDVEVGLRKADKNPQNGPAQKGQVLAPKCAKLSSRPGWKGRTDSSKFFLCLPHALRLHPILPAHKRSCKKWLNRWGRQSRWVKNEPRKFSSSLHKKQRRGGGGMEREKKKKTGKEVFSVVPTIYSFNLGFYSGLLKTSLWKMQGKMKDFRLPRAINKK